MAAGEHWYRALFRAAALWSWAVSVGYFLGETLHEPLLRSLVPEARPRILLDMSVLPTFLFGFAFWSVSTNLTQNHAVVAVGAVGSAMAFVSFAVRCWQGDIPVLLMLPASVDLLFALLMGEFLFRGRRRIVGLET